MAGRKKSSTKKSSPATVPKTVSKTVPKRKKAARKKVAKKTRVVSSQLASEPPLERLSQPILQPVSQPTSQPTQPKVTPKAIERPTESKSVLWLSVGIVTVLIIMLWLYSLQFTIPIIGNSGPTFSEANPQVDEFVDTVEADWSDFQETTDEFESLLDEKITTTNTNSLQPTSKLAPDSQPTTEELNNLFSDIN